MYGLISVSSAVLDIQGNKYKLLGNTRHGRWMVFFFLDGAAFCQKSNLDEILTSTEMCHFQQNFLTEL